MKPQLFILAGFVLTCAGCGGGSSTGPGQLTSQSISNIVLPPGSYTTATGDPQRLSFTISPTREISNALISPGRYLTLAGGTGNENPDGGINLTFSQLTADCRVTNSSANEFYIADVTMHFSNGKVMKMAVTLNSTGV